MKLSPFNYLITVIASTIFASAKELVIPLLCLAASLFWFNLSPANSLLIGFIGYVIQSNYRSVLVAMDAMRIVMEDNDEN